MQLTPLLGHHHLRSDDAHVSFSESTKEKYLILTNLYCVIFWFRGSTSSPRYTVLCVYFTSTSSDNILSWFDAITFLIMP